MKLKDLVPPEVLAELEEIHCEHRSDDPTFNPVRDPIALLTVLVTWCVREIVRMRKERAR